MNTSTGLSCAVIFACAAGCGAPEVPRVVPAPPPPPPASTAKAAEAPPDLRLELSFEARGDRRALVVTERFRGDPDGHTGLELPGEWAGQQGFDRGITDLAVDGATIRDGEAPLERVVDHAPGGDLVLHYRVVETPVASGREHERPYRPIFDPLYFHFFGDAAFVVPGWKATVPRTISLSWRGLPDDAAIANSFGEGAREQRFVASLRDFAHAVYAGGAFRVRRLDVHGQPVFVAIRGTFGFTDDEVAGVAQRVLVTEREFWNDFDFPHFLITMIQSGSGCCSYGGTGVSNAFATFLATDRGVDGKLTYLLAHELFHTWNGRRIGRAQPERLVYWFSEGFTDYYARIFELRAGLIDLAEYVRQVNEMLARYAMSPALHVTNQEVLERFWKDDAVEKIPYQRGALLASNWNVRIGAASKGTKSLDDAMRDLLAAARDKGTVVSAASVDGVIAPYLPGGVADDIARVVDRGEVVAPDGGALGPCVTMAAKSLPSYDAGWDLASKEKVAGVRKDGPAYRAGLRDGQPIVHLRYNTSRVDVPVEVTIREGKREKVISYAPVGRSFDVPQYSIVDAEMTRDKARCLAWFGVNAR